MRKRDDTVDLIHVSGRLFFTARKGVISGALCPICDEPMTLMKKSPMPASGLAHRMYLASRAFFACPRADDPAHRAAVEKYEEVLMYWSLPLRDLLKHDPSYLFRTRRAAVPGVAGDSAQ